MNNLLSLRKNMFLKIKDKKSNLLYRCLSVKDIEVEGYQYSLRYDLQSEINYKKAILEVKKDQENKVIIAKLEKVGDEKVELKSETEVKAIIDELNGEVFSIEKIKEQEKKRR